MSIRSALVRTLADRLVRTEPGTEAARAIYAEAQSTGLADDLAAWLRTSGAALQAESNALQGELNRRERAARSFRIVPGAKR